MVRQEGFSIWEIKRLKRCLLGFCGEETTKSEKQMYKVMRKAQIPYFEPPDNKIKESLELLVELSKSRSLVYRVSTDAKFFLEPDNVFDHILYIRKRNDDSYRVYTTVDQRSAGRDP